MKSLRIMQRLVLVTIVGLLALVLPGQVFAQSGGQAGSLAADDISVLFNVVMVFAVIVFVGVEGLLIFAIVRYRRRSNDEMPEQIHGNNKMELGWTLGSAVLVLILFFFTLGFYQQPRAIPIDEETLTIEVTGNMWRWDFYYPDTGVRMSREFNVPAGQPVVLEIGSADVQHSFWLPGLSGKVDAIPGRVQRMWFEVDDSQQFVGQCAEYCGLEHYNMPITLNVMEPQEYAAWMDGEAAAVAAAASVDVTDLVGDPASGEALYVEQGCVACHTLDGTAGVGPSYLGLGERAGEMVEGLTAEEYIHESIVNPCEFIVDGFACVMPQTYEALLSPQNLADLVAFLKAQ